jgi:hypothetical protein
MDREIDIKMLGSKAKQRDLEKVLEWLNASDPANHYVAGRKTSWLNKMTDEEREEFGLLWQDMVNSMND